VIGAARGAQSDVHRDAEERNCRVLSGQLGLDVRTVPRAVDAGGLRARALAPHSYLPMSQPALRRSSIM
jgi:hypothetical protein